MNAERLGKPPHNVVHEDETLLPTSSNRILFIVFVRGVRLSGYPVHRATAAGDTRRLGIPAHLPICLPHVHAPRQSARVTSGGSLLVSTPLAFLASVYGSGAYRAILNVFPSCSSLGIRRYHHSNRPYDRSSNGTRRWMQDQGKLVELIPRRDLPSRAAVPSLMSDAQPSWRSSASPCYLAVSSSRRQASRRPR
jgi:hypothetical protein